MSQIHQACITSSEGWEGGNSMQFGVRK